jgi:hypothetical protein
VEVCAKLIGTHFDTDLKTQETQGSNIPIDK